jgi:hypothetical protein
MKVGLRFRQVPFRNRFYFNVFKVLVIVCPNISTNSSVDLTSSDDEVQDFENGYDENHNGQMSHTKNAESRWSRCV